MPEETPYELTDKEKESLDIMINRRPRGPCFGPNPYSSVYDRAGSHMLLSDLKKRGMIKDKWEKKGNKEGSTSS